jgi:ribosomal protein S18 acetylase RimI-like enzyme
MEITTHRATAADAALLSVIAKQTFFDTFTGTCTEEDMQQFLEQYFNENQLRTELENDSDFCFFIKVEGQYAGYIRFMEDYSSFELVRKWKALELKRIYVLKEFKGKGIAQRLMQLVMDYAMANHYEVLWLGVWEHNERAQSFYRKYGFEDSGHTHDFPIGNTPQTDNWLWKFL